MLVTGKNLYFDYCALIVMTLIILSILLKRMTRGRTNRYFLLLAVVVFFSVVYDICSIILDNRYGESTDLRYLTHMCYLIIRNLTAPLLAVYTICLTDTWHIIRRKGKLFLSALPLIAIIIAVLSTPFTHAIFYFDNHNVYTRGPLFFILYVSAIFYLFYIILYATAYIKNIGMQKYFAIVSIFPMQVVAMTVQYYYPNILIEMFLTSICALLVLFIVQRPEASIDLTTGFLKASTFNSDMKNVFANKKPVTIIFITTTNFDIIRDLLAYTGTSKLIKVLASRINKINMIVDTEADVYNYESGKFRVVFEEPDFDKVEIFAKELKKLFSSNIKASSLDITLRANVCIAKCPDDIKNFDSLVVFSNEFLKLDFHKEILTAQNLFKNSDYKILSKMEKILTDAIKNRSFEVYYQPIYSIKQKKFISAEALIRLNTEEFGFIRPDLFIPYAEESGLINSIGSIVLEDVCKFISSEDFKSLNLEYIEVNLSVIQCMNIDLVPLVSGLLNKYNVRPDQINLEVTETATAYSQQIIHKNISDLNAMGISFSLDDFGTGYSNMIRIAELPLSIIKIDKSMINTENNPDLEVILTQSIKMIKDMNLEIVVEGVETESLLGKFIGLGCEYIQGYFFSKPLPRKDFVKFIMESNEK